MKTVQHKQKEFGTVTWVMPEVLELSIKSLKDSARELGKEEVIEKHLENVEEEMAAQFGLLTVAWTMAFTSPEKFRSYFELIVKTFEKFDMEMEKIYRR